MSLRSGPLLTSLTLACTSCVDLTERPLYWAAGSGKGGVGGDGRQMLLRTIMVCKIIIIARPCVPCCHVRFACDTCCAALQCNGRQLRSLCGAVLCCTVLCCTGLSQLAEHTWVPRA
jgi:hypothetical protein